MNLSCELIVSSDIEHLRQIYAGFSILHRKGFLNLKQTIPKESLQNRNDTNRWVNYKFFNAEVIVNEKIKICYDTHDWNWIDEEILREVDFYFKRSYDEDFISQLSESNKIFPLGLNYQVSNSGADLFSLQRSAFYNYKDKIKNLAKTLQLNNLIASKAGRGTEKLSKLESYPIFNLEPKILFMTRAWNPLLIEAKTQKESVEALNETRAASVRILRKEFGERFFGGLAHDDYAVRHFKDCLLPNGNLSSKQKYLEILKDFPICVTTTGLNRSNGWKLGEYVALSKAVITEPLHFQVTGSFEKETNYLEFTSPDKLLDAAARLFENKSLRSEIMVNNYHYYQSFLKPDALILNSLVTVFQNQIL